MSCFKQKLKAFVYGLSGLFKGVFFRSVFLAQALLAVCSLFLLCVLQKQAFPFYSQSFAGYSSSQAFFKPASFKEKLGQSHLSLEPLIAQNLFKQEDFARGLGFRLEAGSKDNLSISPQSLSDLCLAVARFEQNSPTAYKKSFSPSATSFKEKLGQSHLSLEPLIAQNLFKQEDFARGLGFRLEAGSKGFAGSALLPEAVKAKPLFKTEAHFDGDDKGAPIQSFFKAFVIEQLFPSAYADDHEGDGVEDSETEGCHDAMIAAQEATSGMNPEEIKQVGEATVDAAEAGKIGSARTIHYGAATLHSAVSAVTLARYSACSSAIDECISTCESCPERKGCETDPPTKDPSVKEKCITDAESDCKANRSACSGLEGQCNGAAVSSIISGIAAAQSFMAARQLGGCDKNDASCDESLQNQIACQKDPSLPQCKNKKKEPFAKAPKPPATGSPTPFSNYTVSSPGSNASAEPDKPSPTSSHPSSAGKPAKTSHGSGLPGPSSAGLSPSSSYAGLQSSAPDSAVDSLSSLGEEGLYSPGSSGTAKPKAPRRMASAEGKAPAGAFFGGSQGAAGRSKPRSRNVRRGGKSKKKAEGAKKEEEKNIKQQVFKKTNPHDSVFERSSKIISSFCLQELKCR